MAVELVENRQIIEESLLKSTKIDGEHINAIYEALVDDVGYKSANNIKTNAVNVTQYFVDPIKQGLSKVLCMGKVQSGKTSFFISAIALAFDNGYNITYLIGGTKNKLREQNAERVSQEFVKDPNVVVYEANKTDSDQVKRDIHNGKSVVIVVLKNAAKSTNLGKIKVLIEELKDYPSIVVDDEGDEVSPGAPKKKAKLKHGGRAHDAISEIIKSIPCCTYLSVTATPQANILLSTIDDLSPDYITLVEPGAGYTGGNAFHDIMDNPHVIKVEDTNQFEKSIPDSFQNCLHFFIFACCLKNDEKPYSMLLHPSASTAIHNTISKKIVSYIYHIKGILCDPSHFAYKSSIDIIRNAYDEYVSLNKTNEISFDAIKGRITEVLNNLSVYVYNTTSLGKASMEEEKADKNLYKIYIGGQMLERGLTIKNLIVTYIYRDSKETAIDSLYQRARWFGYKLSYFDVCRVYMPRKLNEKFIVTVESENDLWNSVRAFLLSKTNFKEFPRIFTLNYADGPDGKLILTRKSVSNTVIDTIQRTNPGYNYDKSILFEKGYAYNRALFEAFFDKWKGWGNPVQFGTVPTQVHYVIDMKLSDFYMDFLSKYDYPTGSRFSDIFFQKLLSEIANNSLSDSILVVVMRYKSRQFRSLDPTGWAIQELPQGRSNDGISYEGDKNLSELSGKLYMQLHLVYNGDDVNDYVPMIAFNNPITVKLIKYVTGDNDYGTV